MFLVKIKKPDAKKEDIEDCMDYLFKEIRETKKISSDLMPRKDYEMIREDVHREFQDFINVLDILEDFDSPLRDRFDEYRSGLRAAAATLFDTNELTLIFGRHRANAIEEQLYYLYWLRRNYRTPLYLYERSKIALLQRLQNQGMLDSTKDKAYLQRVENFLARNKKKIHRNVHGRKNVYRFYH